MGNASSKGPFSFAMLVYQSVTAPRRCTNSNQVPARNADPNVHCFASSPETPQKHTRHTLATHEDMEQLGILTNKNHFSTTLVFQIPGLFRSFG